jgi:hypothetical protein
VASSNHRLFRTAWLSVNLLLVFSLMSLLYACAWEHSVRRYLDGFSDAVVPDAASPEHKVEIILNWMRTGSPRAIALHPEELSLRDPETTLNYQQPLNVCGTATNAFLNLARSSDLRVRRLLLLGPDRRAKHVVAEVLVEGRWIVVDPSYRVLLRDAQGKLLTRKDLQDASIFAQATSTIPNYRPEYNYERFAHVRLARLPLDGLGLRRLLDWVMPEWEEMADWSLILERESFAMLVLSACLASFSLLLRFVLAWYADRRLHFSRSHLREKLFRAGAVLLTSPELK